MNKKPEHYSFPYKNVLERLVSDLVHYKTSKKKKKPFDVNKLILGQDPNGGHPYYKDLSMGKFCIYEQLKFENTLQA